MMARPKKDPVYVRRPMLADKCPCCGKVTTLTAKSLGALHALTEQHYAAHAAVCRGAEKRAAA